MGHFLILYFQELAKLLEDQHGYIDLHNIPEHKYYSMDQNPDEEEKLNHERQSPESKPDNETAPKEEEEEYHDYIRWIFSSQVSISE